MSGNIIETTEELVKPIVDQMNLELVDVEFTKEGPNRYLRVFIDKEGGVDIEDCGMVSERLSEKLDEVDPAQQQLTSAHFVTPKADSAEAPEPAAIAFGDPLHERFEIAVPGHDDCGQPIADGCDHGIRSAGGKYVANVLHFVSSLDEYGGD